MMMTTPKHDKKQSLVLALLMTAAMGAADPLNADTLHESRTITVAGVQVEEIAPGLLMGYLSEDERLDSIQFVLPAPASDSARQALDTAVASDMPPST